MNDIGNISAKDGELPSATCAEPSAPTTATDIGHVPNNGVPHPEQPPPRAAPDLAAALSSGTTLPSATDNQGPAGTDQGPADQDPADQGGTDGNAAGDGEGDEDRQAARLACVLATITAETATLAASEAARLVAIAELYAFPCMTPHSSSVPFGGAKPGEFATVTRADVTESELLHLLHLSPYEAGRLVEVAVGLTTRLPKTLQALKEGRLDRKRAEIIHDHAKPLADDHYARAGAAGLSPESAQKAGQNIASLMEKRLLKYAAGQSPGGLNRSGRLAVMRLDPEFADRQRQENERGRSVSRRIDPLSSTGTISARLGAADALAVYEVLDAYARLARHRGDPRTLDQLRADTFTHLIIYGSLPDGSTTRKAEPARVIPRQEPYSRDLRPEEIVHEHTCDLGDQPPCPEAAQNAAAEPAGPTTSGNVHDGASFWPPNTRRSSPPPSTKPDVACPTCGGCPSGPTVRGSGVRTHVQVTMGFETLLGLNEEPGELAGFGPISAAQARALAFDPGSTWRRLVTDEVTGYLLNYGRTVYQAPAPLGDHVRARDVLCRTPHCERPAIKCDLDHLLKWPIGDTSDINLYNHCRHDHRLKHQGGWRHEICDDADQPAGTIMIISPAGQVYYSYSFAYPTGNREYGSKTPDPTDPYGWASHLSDGHNGE